MNFNDNIGFELTWVLLGLLGFLTFSAYMFERNRQYVVRNPLHGTLLFVAALVLGPISFVLFYIYALMYGAVGELNARFNPAPARQDRHNTL